MINITNEDNMELMSRYEDNHFDLAIVDPPYGIGDWVSKYRNDNKIKTYKSGNKKGTKHKRTTTKWKKINWNNNIPNKKYFNELNRVSKEQIVWGANYYNCFSINGGAIIWNKKVNEKSNMSVCEIASYSKHKKVSYYEGIWQNVNRTENIIHPCQKPVKLYEWLLMNFAKEGDKILDTYLGSGSIAIACHNLGYNLTACELDKEYYEAAMKRLQEHQSQLRII
jgi:site-specific DNA-methyltransferase (adenine-specific)